MFSATRHRIAALALGVCFILPAQAKKTNLMVKSPQCRRGILPPSSLAA